MSTTLNYILKFNSDADKVSASVLKLDKGLKSVQSQGKKLAKGFSAAMDKMNSSLSGVKMHAFIQNMQSASQGLSSLSEPGLKLNASLADLSAITGVTGKGLKELEGYARTNAKTFGGDAAQGVESYKLILSQLNPEIAKTPKALQAMGTHVSTLSKTMGGDAGAATEVLTTAMNQYQVSTKNPIAASKKMASMMNVMAAAAKEGSAELPQQKAALQQSGMAAKGAALKFYEHAAAIQVLDKAGKKGSEGGVALRNTLSTLSQGRFLPKDVQKELKAAGVDINVLGDKSIAFTERLKPLRKIMDDSALVTKLFGKENSNAAVALISGIQAQEELKGKIQGTNTAYDQAAIVMESQTEKNARLKASIDDMKISLFNGTGGALGYASALGDIAFDVSNLMPIVSGFGKTMQFITSATKMQALWTNIVSGATKVWTGVQWAMNAALNANPIGLIVAGVVALGAAIAWVVSKTEGWGEAWKHTVEGAKHLFTAYVEGIKLQFSTVVNGIMIGIDKIKLGWYKFKEAMGLGNSSENKSMIAKINADTEARKKAVIDQAKKVADAALKAKDKFGAAVGSVKWKTEQQAAAEGATGIADPKIAGAAGGGGTAPDPSKGAGAKANKAIATGGTKNNVITINIESLIQALEIKGNDFKDSAKQLQDQSTDALLRTLAMAATAGA